MENISDQLLPKLIGLKSNEIQDMKTAVSDGNQSIYVTMVRKRPECCPKCGCIDHVVSNGYYQRKILTSSEILEGDALYLKLPRWYCEDCHSSFSQEQYLAPQRNRISYATVMKVMELLKDPHITFEDAGNLCKVSPSSVIRVFDRHCHLPSVTFPEAMCIDEVYTKDSDFKDSKYSCIFYDFYRHRLVDVLPARTKNYLHNYFQPYQGTGCLNTVRYIVMDMHSPYRDIARLYFKKAIICVDSFHVIKQLNDSLSNLRIRVMKRYEPGSIEYYLLKNWNWLLFDRTVELDNKGKFNKRLDRYVNYRQLLELLLSIDDQLRLAWQIKEEYTNFNATATYESAQELLEEQIQKITISNIPEYGRFLSSICHWRKEIVNSFIIYKGFRLNNGVAESLNATVSTLLFNTRGIRNSERRKKRIMYAVNKDQFLIG